MSILLPLTVEAPLSSRHFPCSPLMGRPGWPGMTQVLALLLQSDCIANDPVARVTSPSGLRQAHLSPISPPDTVSFWSTQPNGGNGSVTDSAYSCPPTILSPS